MKVKSESEVAQSCLTLSNPMECSPPGSSVHGIFQATVLEFYMPSPHGMASLLKFTSINSIKQASLENHLSASH